VFASIILLFTKIKIKRKKEGKKMKETDFSMRIEVLIQTSNDVLCATTHIRLFSNTQNSLTRESKGGIIHDDMHLITQ